MYKNLRKNNIYIYNKFSRIHLTFHIVHRIDHWLMQENTLAVLKIGQRLKPRKFYFERFLFLFFVTEIFYFFCVPGD